MENAEKLVSQNSVWSLADSSVSVIGCSCNNGPSWFNMLIVGLVSDQYVDLSYYLSKFAVDLNLNLKLDHGSLNNRTHWEVHPQVTFDLRTQNWSSFDVFGHHTGPLLCRCSVIGQDVTKMSMTNTIQNYLSPQMKKYIFYFSETVPFLKKWQEIITKWQTLPRLSLRKWNRSKF